MNNFLRIIKTKFSTRVLHTTLALIGGNSVIFASPIKLAIGSAEPIFDPQKMQSLGSMFVVKQLFRGLLKYNAVGIVEADLATSWKISKDRLSYTFIIGNHKFSNGAEITSEDVVVTFLRMFSEKSAIAADLSLIVGSNSVLPKIANQNLKPNDAFGVKVVNKKTVAFSLKAPNPIFLQQLASIDCAILNAKEQLSSNFVVTNQTLFSGAYKIANQVVADGRVTSLQLEKWRPSEEESVKTIKTVTLDFVSPDFANLSQNTKNYDALLGMALAKKSLDELSKLNWIQKTTDLGKQYWILMNPNRIPLEKRKLIALGFENSRAKVLKDYPSLKPAFGIIPSILPGSLKAEDGDIVLGRPQDTPKPEVPTRKYEFVFAEESPFYKNIVEKYFSSALEKEINFKSTPLSKVFELMGSKNYDGLIMAKGMDYPEGISLLSYFKSNYHQNDYFIADKKLDRMISEAQVEQSQEKRIELYRTIQQEILNFKTVLPMFEGNTVGSLWTEKWKNIPEHPMGYQFLSLESLELR
jgi:ABC-type oligopeptide transport system substrate-binding subunit